eukprot:TRINITY_DN12630_c0_g3_i2.p1 TRINITY_DN12630_c0_g3~~TRINITY_DN12630_c0_g3_i2.p1  ORF type:complete len:328 (-),score=26.08 TRINITY_DN12630_c0_g3_i2:203-1186(-)
MHGVKRGCKPTVARVPISHTGGKLADALDSIFATHPDMWGALPGDGTEMCSSKSVDFVLTEDIEAAGDSAVLSAFVLSEGHLGLGFWCLPRVYATCHKRFAELRRGIQGHFERNLPCWADAGQPARQVGDAVFRTTRTLLLVNADYASALNARKELVGLGYVTFEQEIEFLNLLLTRHPKSSECWAHRRWLFQKHCPDQCALLLSESEVCELVCKQYPRNYYAWTHLRWLLQIASQQLHGSEQQRECGKAYILAQLSKSDRWTARHASDYSGWNYRQGLLLELGADHLPARLRDEVSLLETFLRAAPAHDSIWTHARFVVYVHNYSC